MAFFIFGSYILRSASARQERVQYEFHREDRTHRASYNHKD
jgi:hypothetical protein